MKVSPKTHVTSTHGHGRLKLGKEVCLCGRPAIKFKLSDWCCERCNRIEEDMNRNHKKYAQLRAIQEQKTHYENNS